MERGWREMSPNCPRCGSTNTKFCYYNNYSLTQPRYFCKGCRRYWTKGGSLRNVPVGGGCRKSRRGNKLALRVTSGPTITPYPNVTPTSCRTTINGFGHVIMNSNAAPSSSTSSSTSTIDLAVVYANFLKPKTPQERDERHHINLPISHSNHPDQLSRPPPLDQVPGLSQANNMELALPFGLKDHEYLGEQGNQLLLLHHHNHDKQQDQGHMTMQNPSSSACDHDHGGALGELLPPLPGDEEVVISPWEKNNNHDHQLIPSSNDHNIESNTLQSPMQDPLEAEAQFSSLFNIEGCWSPLNFSGYSDIRTPVEATTTAPATIGDIRHQQWP
ncbi:hypothetical protein V2J09_010137 [Rumex salicifolius]